VLSLAGCSAGTSSPVGPSDASSSAAVVASPCDDSGAGQIDIQIMRGFQSTMYGANDAAATCQQVRALLQQSVAYDKSVPPITDPIVPAGYVGPPVLTIADGASEMIITPSWYVDPPSPGQISWQQVTNVLEVDAGGRTVHIWNPPLYDWLYNSERETSFHCLASWCN